MISVTSCFALHVNHFMHWGPAHSAAFKTE